MYIEAEDTLTTEVDILKGHLRDIRDGKLKTNAKFNGHRILDRIDQAPYNVSHGRGVLFYYLSDEAQWTLRNAMPWGKTSTVGE